MFVFKKYVYICFIQLIFSFFLFLPQSFAYEQDIYYYPPNDDTGFMSSDLMRKDSTFYFKDLSRQYLRNQTPYIPLPKTTEIDSEKQPQVQEPSQENAPDNEPKNQNISATENLSKIVIIIDDMGVNRKRSEEISQLKYPLTASFLTYAPHLKEQIEESQKNGQEIMVHIPMEPKIMQNYTNQMLTTDMTDEEIIKTLNEMLAQIPQAVAINNHMGSKFTEDEYRMGVVMRVLKEKGLIFVDSKTSAKTQGYKQAQILNVVSFIRDIFLDNENNYDYILSQLQKTEKIALKKGYAIAIGHPKEQTYKALKDWLPSLEEKGLQLIPISKMKNYQAITE